MHRGGTTRPDAEVDLEVRVVGRAAGRVLVVEHPGLSSSLVGTPLMVATKTSWPLRSSIS